MVVVLVQASELSAKGQSSQAVRRSALLGAPCGRRVKRWVGKGVKGTAEVAKKTDFVDRRLLGSSLLLAVDYPAIGQRKV